MKSKIISIFLIAFLFLNASAQRNRAKTDDKPEGYKFTTVVSLDATPVKNQSRTGTCWCFATTSFMESELLRMGKGEYDLSEMFIVRHNYVDRLQDNYLRRGNGNLGPGSLAHDWLVVFEEHGMVPEEVFSGINYDSETHNHSELQGFINAIAEVPVQRRNQSEQYHQVVDAVLDTYLGEIPSSFEYQGSTYTPESFARSLGINPDDYVEITSFSHFPFYTKGLVEVPDNWRHEKMYNVPIDELVEIMDYALENGYTVDWDGDVSERGFSHANGVAINPDVNKIVDLSETDRARFENIARGRSDEGYSFDKPLPEIDVTQEIRQEGYEAFTTTDDHLMHVTGLVKDQNGTKYYITKNSWGTDRNTFGGYLNMSESYVKAKVIFIMVHKDAVPAGIREKLGI
ncbi:MAG: C1 family peptidase [Bacteroidales bacterium]|nr:C1 family peptidase [Bacteroidales bacterium]